MSRDAQNKSTKKDNKKSKKIDRVKSKKRFIIKGDLNNF